MLQFPVPIGFKNTLKAKNTTWELTFSKDIHISIVFRGNVKYITLDEIIGTLLEFDMSWGLQSYTY